MDERTALEQKAFGTILTVSAAYKCHEQLNMQLFYYSV